MNKCVLIGNLTRDPEMRSTKSGVPVCTFTLAVNRRMPNAQGVREADFITCVAWRKTAEFVNQYFTKGKKIAVTGSIQSRSYDDNDGATRWVTEVVADEVEFVESKAGQTGGSGQAETGRSESTQTRFDEADNADLPF